jgi:putative spermidine/putrescine transport system permease protein
MRRRTGVWPWVVIGLCAAYFIVPMLAMARFALQRVPVSLLGRETLFSRWTFAGLWETLTDEKFQPAALLSLRLAVITALAVNLLLVPTIILLNWRLRSWRTVSEAVSLLPYVVPPIALVVGVTGAFKESVPWLVTSNYGLVPFYIVICLPFSYRALDVGVAALDLSTLIDAARSMGASWWTTVTKVLLPNMRVALLTSLFLAFAVVLGEYAVSSLLLKQTLPLYMVEAQGRNPQGAMAVSLLLLVLTTGIFAVLGRAQRRSKAGVVAQEVVL